MKFNLNWLLNSEASSLSPDLHASHKVKLHDIRWPQLISQAEQVFKVAS